MKKNNKMRKPILFNNISEGTTYKPGEESEIFQSPEMEHPVLNACEKLSWSQSLYKNNENFLEQNHIKKYNKICFD